jgi:hypothetical protein
MAEPWLHAAHRREAAGLCIEGAIERTPGGPGF